MATLIRTTLLRTAGGGALCRVSVSAAPPARCISGREMRASRPPGPPKPKPFDHEFKNFTWYRSIWDYTTSRFDENTKVICVEGPVGVGKTEFARKLAEELDMRHFPEANMDMHYCLPNGLNLREFDPLVPEDTRTFDHVKFCQCPNHRLAGNFQIQMYWARYSQYIDALAHLLNSGQGVVLERSPFSDFVFLEAMFAQNYISKGVRSVYYDLRDNTIQELMRPHLVVYLDIPVETVQQRIRNRGHSHEVNSDALSADYLKILEHQYKHKYLRDISTHAELLVYDWTGGGEIDVVVEDIERLNFEQYSEREDPKMKDWRLVREVDWAKQRALYTNSKDYLMNLFNLPRADVPELVTSGDDQFAWEQVVYAHPKMKYEFGYNADAGDRGLFTKTKMPKYSVQYY